MTRSPVTGFGRRVWRVRLAAYVGFAGMAATFALEAQPRWPFIALAAVLLGTPYVVCALERRFRARAQWIENVATPLVLALASMPVLPVAAACAALLAGTLAQRGYRALPMALSTIGAGAIAGHALDIGVRFDATLLAAALSFAFVIAFCTPLAAWGYEEAVKEQRARREIDARSLVLERHRDTLIRYLPDDLARRLDAGSTAPIRRWLTVVAVDLEMFTALLERLAPEDVVAVLDDVYGALARMSREHGGVLHKFLGDGALVCFGAAETRGRRVEARECVRFVDALAAALVALNERWLHDGIGACVSARTGVASGFCTVGALGRDDRFDFTLIGLPVNLASRLQAQAPRAGALIDAATAALLDDDARARLSVAVEMAIKGFAAPVRVHSLTPLRAHGAATC
jgi:class 3 adenylate cyclase